MERYYNVATATIADVSQKSSAINITGFKYIAIEIPTASVGTEASTTVTVYCEGSDTSTGTFREIFNQQNRVYNQAQTAIVNILSAGTGGVLATVNAFIPNFIKICLKDTTATAAGYACKVHMYM